MLMLSVQQICFSLPVDQMHQAILQKWPGPIKSLLYNNHKLLQIRHCDEKKYYSTLLFNHFFYITDRLQQFGPIIRDKLLFLFYFLSERAPSSNIWHLDVIVLHHPLCLRH